MILKLKELREEKEMTQSELAKAINSAQRNISNWETGKNEPDCQAILAIANFFKVPIDRLFGRTLSSDPTSELDKALLQKIDTLSKMQKVALLNFLKNF